MTGTSLLAAGSTFTPDLMGNIVNYTIPGYGSVLYGYDTFNRMNSVTAFGALAGTYGYNAYGERTSKVAGSARTRFVYTDDHTLIAERADSSGLWTNYLWFGGELVGMTRGGVRYAVHNDHLGRPELVTNTSKGTAWKSNNGAFGGPHPATIDTIDGFNIGFPGQYYDAESGLWYNMNRYYDQNTGRYWQVDPIGLESSVNPFAYVDGNPVNSYDPLGLQAYTPGLTPPSNIPGGPWTPAPGQPPGTFYGPPGTDRMTCRYVPDAKNGGPASATKEAYWKTKTPSTKWQRYSLKGKAVTPQQAHPGTRNGVSLGFRVTVAIWLLTYSAELNASEDEMLEMEWEPH
jgi:RHS repeat-associated protein